MFSLSRRIKRCIMACSLIAVVYITVRWKNKDLVYMVKRYDQSNEFPECPYLGLQNPIEKNTTNDYQDITCVPHRPTKKACKEAIEIFGNTKDLPEKKCNSKKYKELCTFKYNKAQSKDNLLCDWTPCFPYSPSIGEVNNRYGIVVDWKSSPTMDEIKHIIARSISNRFYFVFFKCGNLKQVLRLPHKIIKSAQPQKHISINIILVDSVARPHFYRSLPRTIKALRNIVNNNSTRATVLDFELLQSVSQHTMDNCRPLYSGVTTVGDTNFNSSRQKEATKLGIPVLFGKYKKLGYQTIFQEEGCWYDHWGLMLTDVARYETPETKEDFEKGWAALKKFWRDYPIDDFGMTHFTCQVVKDYGYTNDLDRPSKVCFNGEFISSYYFNYQLEYLKSRRNHDDEAPYLHYLHLVTGHTSSAVRIRNDDVGLANYVTELAHDVNTLTIIMSDHGHSRSTYGQTIEGRFELFNPLFFVILPENVASLLGTQRVNALVENQRRLFTTLDVHKMLMAMHDPVKMYSTDYTVNGLLSVLPSNRTCENLPLTPMTRCKCEGWDQRVENNSPRHAWLAEYAIGELNNMIQDQFMKGRTNPSGFGACTRLRGLETKNNVERQTEMNLEITMDIITDSALHNKVEVFQVMLRTSIIPQTSNAAKLIKFDRLTLYNKYMDCNDKGVNIMLCACVKRNTDDPSRTADEIRKLATKSMFGVKTTVKNLDKEECLLLLSRKQNHTLTYEICNVCEKTYKVEVKGNDYNMLITAELPLEIIVKPRTIHFLLSASRYVLSDSFLNIETIYEVVQP